MTGARLRRELLTDLYGSSRAHLVGDRVERILLLHQRHRPPSNPWSEQDAWLITYADQFQAEGESPLRTLDRFMAEHLDLWVNGVHVLPFYPWSSDDGFSVTNYTQVEPAYGSWQDVENLAGSRRLVVDAVINHMSIQSSWFASFLNEEEGFTGLFQTADPSDDLSAVVRPRTSPLLTRVERTSGPAWVWTTFSADQVDLNYQDPQTLIRILEVLLMYARHGARVIRLDAIAFLWKQTGTSCLHLPQTHAVIRFIRSCFDDTYASVLLLTETNVPHAENISYFGAETEREAQIVYQFPLAPLVLDAFRTGDATILRSWAADLGPNRPGTTFLNFLASHDGVGVRPAEGLLPPERVAALTELSRAAGGEVGTRLLPDGSEAPYELNSTWFDLLGAGHNEENTILRHQSSHAIMLALRGIPAIYVHSLFGSSNDHTGSRASGRARSLNRHKFADVGRLVARIADPSTREHRVLNGLRAMLKLRAAHPAFHPDADQQVLASPQEILAIERVAADGAGMRILVNCSDHEVPISDLVSGWDEPNGAPSGDRLGPWQALWLRRNN